MASSARIEQWILTGGSASSSAIWVFLMVQRLVDRLALDPLGDQRTGGDGGTAAVGLELGVLDDAVLLTLICSFMTSPQAGAPTMPVPTPSSSLSKAPTLRGFS
jgi:hypothetical protein